MQASVTELLRDFPRIKRAALSGETVIIKSREGNLRLMLDAGDGGPLLGSLKGLIRQASDEIDRSRGKESEWALWM